MTYTKSELTEIAAAIASRVGVSLHAISVTQKVDGLLTVKVGDNEFTGTLEQIWAWVDDLVKDHSATSDFEP